MPNHKAYSALRTKCLQCGEAHRPDVGEGHMYRASFVNNALVDIFCQGCGELAASYHREPGLERSGTKADPSLIGKTVTATRYIGWIGYAHSTFTTGLWGTPLQDKAVKTMLEFLKAVGIQPTEKQIGDLDEAVRFGLYRGLPDNQDMPYEEMSYAMQEAVRAIERSAEWHYRRQRYQEDCGIRGLWFSQPYTVTGCVMEIVAGQTGVRGIGGNYAGEWEPNYLYNNKTHNLYGIGYDHPQCLVHPDDIVEIR